VVCSSKVVEPHENLVWLGLSGGTREITVEVIPKDSTPTTIIDLHTGLINTLEAVDKTEGVIIEIIDKILLALKEAQMPMEEYFWT
jgi:hypothetical protein